MAAILKIVNRHRTVLLAGLVLVAVATAGPSRVLASVELQKK